MGKLTKNQKKAQELLEVGKEYSLEEASKLLKEITFSKFDASVDLDVRLGVDPKKADQMVRGVVSFPHGVGKDVKVWYYALLIRSRKQKMLVQIM